MQIVIRVADDLPREQVEKLLQQIEEVVEQEVVSIAIENTPSCKVFAHRIPVEKIVLPSRDELHE